MAFTDIGSAEYEFAGVSSATYTLAAVAVPDLDANSIGVVSVAFTASGTATVTGVTWGGSAMAHTDTATNGPRSAELWYLANPPDNGNKDIVVTCGDASLRTGSVVAKWANADGAVTLDDHDSESANDIQTPDIVSNQAGANEFVVSVSVTNDNSIADPSTTGCTELQRYDAGNACMITAYSIPAGSGNTTHQHNYTGTEGDYAMVSASFKEAAGGGPTMAWDDRGIMRGMNCGLQRGQGI